MRVMGIDPGTRVVGYGVVDSVGNTISALAFGAIRPRSNIYAERLLEIATEVERLTREFNPAVVAIEKAFYGKNVQSAMRIGEGRAAAIVGATRAGASVVEYAPRLVKQAVVGSGGAHKTQVQEMVRIILSLEEKPKPIDASDALAIAICHCHRAVAWNNQAGGPGRL